MQDENAERERERGVHYYMPQSFRELGSMTGQVTQWLAEVPC